MLHGSPIRGFRWLARGRTRKAIRPGAGHEAIRLKAARKGDAISDLEKLIPGFGGGIIGR
jgi:hypothetical protein